MLGSCLHPPLHTREFNKKNKRYWFKITRQLYRLNIQQFKNEYVITLTGLGGGGGEERQMVSKSSELYEAPFFSFRLTMISWWPLMRPDNSQTCHESTLVVLMDWPVKSTQLQTALRALSLLLASRFLVGVPFICVHIHLYGSHI